MLLFLFTRPNPEDYRSWWGFQGGSIKSSRMFPGIGTFNNVYHTDEESDHPSRYRRAKQAKRVFYFLLKQTHHLLPYQITRPNPENYQSWWGFQESNINRSLLIMLKKSHIFLRECSKQLAQTATDGGSSSWRWRCRDWFPKYIAAPRKLLCVCVPYW